MPRGTRAKDIDVQFGAKQVRAGLRGKAPVVHGRLFGTISVNDSTWTIDSVNGLVSMHFEKDKAFSGRWTLLVIDAVTPGDVATIDAHSAFMLAARLESDSDASASEQRALALLLTAAERKHPLAMKRMFDVYAGDDVHYGPDKRDIAALVRLAEVWGDVKSLEKLGKRARARARETTAASFDGWMTPMLLLLSWSLPPFARRLVRDRH